MKGLDRERGEGVGHDLANHLNMIFMRDNQGENTEGFEGASIVATQYSSTPCMSC